MSTSCGLWLARSFIDIDIPETERSDGICLSTFLRKHKSGAQISRKAGMDRCSGPSRGTCRGTLCRLLLEGTNSASRRNWDRVRSGVGRRTSSHGCPPPYFDKLHRRKNSKVHSIVLPIFRELPCGSSLISQVDAFLKSSVRVSSSWLSAFLRWQEAPYSKRSIGRANDHQRHG